MFKPIKIAVITACLNFVLLSFGICEESITITTYYPSPYGSYNDLYVANSVGIGISAPEARLTVSGTNIVNNSPVETNIGEYLSQASWNGVHSTGTGPSSQQFEVILGASRWSAAPTEASYGVYVSNNGTKATDFALYVASGKSYFAGNVGIGVQNPEAQLDLSTDLARKSSTTTWTTGSDIRLKRDIRPFTDGITTINKIKPVWFKWNSKAGHIDDGKDNIGVIGQEIKKVAPYTVTMAKAKLEPTDKNETEIIDFTSHALIFVLINAVKELDTKISEVKKENSGLRQRIMALEKIRNPG